jgi:hypothetical protein
MASQGTPPQVAAADQKELEKVKPRVPTIP